MEDMLFKTGVVLIGVVVIVVLISFAITSLNKTNVKDEYLQTFSDNGRNVELRIASLCDLCLSRAVDRDCYLMNVTASSIVDPVSLSAIDPRFNLTSLLDEGQHLLKIKNSNMECVVYELES